MRMVGSDPDLATIVSRIKNGDLDLQPDFQRGEVWGDPKKRRLIDTILREWHVPPVHVIELENTARQVVLDGQQRLAAIRDFVEGKLTIDGSIQPESKDIAALDGFAYGQLPPEWRRRFDQFTLRVIRIVDYTADEPGELFFRLNQPTNLTSAEQRNAFFGDTRQQVRELVGYLEARGPGLGFIGFSNSRMAYDDVMARLCVAIEQQTLKKKITAGILAERYRSGIPFSEHVVDRCHAAVELLSCARDRELRNKLNKATLFTLLYFAQEAGGENSAPILDAETMSAFVFTFDEWRTQLKTLGQRDAFPPLLSPSSWTALFSTYEDRSTSRVQDVISVRVRDAVLWFAFAGFCSLHGLALEHPRLVAAQSAASWAISAEKSEKEHVGELLGYFLEEPFLELLL